MERLKPAKLIQFHLYHKESKQKRMVLGNQLMAQMFLIGLNLVKEESMSLVLTTQAFPTLFPFGRGDPTSKQRHNTVTLSDAFKHLIRSCDKSPDGSNRWRFASHPRFPYWALNMKHRHQLLSQSSIFLKQNPTDAHLTIEQLRDMVGRFDSTNLISRI